MERHNRYHLLDCFGQSRRRQGVIGQLYQLCCQPAWASIVQLTWLPVLRPATWVPSATCRQRNCRRRSQRPLAVAIASLVHTPPKLDVTPVSDAALPCTSAHSLTPPTPPTRTFQVL